MYKCHCSISGLTDGFNSRFCDRFSFIQAKDRIDCKSSAELERLVRHRRTPAESELDYSTVERGEESSRGVVRRPIINQVPHFHVQDFGSTPSCTGHDVFTGFGEWVKRDKIN